MFFVDPDTLQESLDIQIWKSYDCLLAWIIPDDGTERVDQAPTDCPCKKAPSPRDGVQYRPTDWRPGHVRNPVGLLDTHFTDAAAWEFIASNLEDGHPVEIVALQKPAGATGYVMKIKIEPGRPLLYVKLQLGSGKIIGRSFHYSETARLKGLEDGPTTLGSLGAGSEDGFCLSAVRQ